MNYIVVSHTVPNVHLGVNGTRVELRGFIIVFGRLSH